MCRNNTKQQQSRTHTYIKYHNNKQNTTKQTRNTQTAKHKQKQDKQRTQET